jgi:hypothetical protein
MHYLAKSNVDEVLLAWLLPRPHPYLDLGGIELIYSNDWQVLSFAQYPIPADIAAI